MQLVEAFNGRSGLVFDEEARELGLIVLTSSGRSQRGMFWAFSTLTRPQKQRWDLGVHVTIDEAAAVIARWDASPGFKPSTLVGEEAVQRRMRGRRRA